MPVWNLVSLLLLSFLFVFAGVSHFRNPRFFLSITPPWVPAPEKVNVLVGTIEILLGLALIPLLTRAWAAMGIIVLLVVVFPANVYHFQKARKKGKGVIATLIRLPIQGLFIYWAYSFIF